MKIIKKMFSVMLIFSLVLAQGISIVNAANGKNDNSGKITISNAIVDQDYSVYQILKLESYDTTKGAFAYKAATSEWSTFLNSTEIKDVFVEIDEQGYVTWLEGADQALFARKALKYASDNSIAAEKSKKAVSTTVEFLDLNLGYYLVDSSLGALCGLTTTKPEAIVKEKNAKPSAKKEVEEDSNLVYGSTDSAEIGQIVNYKTTVTVQAGAENYVLYDVMEPGLTSNDDVVVEGVDAENYSVDYTDSKYTFILTFDNDYILGLTAGTELVVKYSAVVNKDAVIESTGNKNTTFLKYGDKNNVVNKTTPSETITYVYQFDLVKTNKDNEILKGAEFELYRAGERKPLEFVLVSGSDETNVFKYRLATADDNTTTTIIKAGVTTIVGLDLDIYKLKEIVAPNGYNKLASEVTINVNLESVRTDVVITDEIYTSGGVEIENLNGTELPSTGGIGTMLFVTIGSIMVLGFGVLLVTKLRMSKISI